MKIKRDILIFMEDFIEKKEAAARLKVCLATVDNWVRQGLLESSGKKAVSLSSLEKLLEKIERGEIDRLQKRANRSFCVKKSTQFEEDRFLLLLFLILFQLYHRKELILPHFSSLMDFIPLLREATSSQSEAFCHFFNRKAVANWVYQKIITNKPSLIEFLASDKLIFDLFSQMESEYLPDFPLYSPEGVGLAYQKMQKKREKVFLGAWYTPIPLIQASIASIFNENPQLSSQILLDPCCGCGSFLLAAASHLSSPENLMGIDLDEWAIWIAGINLYLAFPHWEGSLNLFCQNSLEIQSSFFKKPIGLFFTNPPWGAKVEKRGQKDSRVITRESFTHFLALASQCCCEKSQILLLLPYSAFSIRKHQDFRTILQQDFDSITLKHLNKAIPGVISEVVLLKAIKRANQKGSVALGALDFLFWNDSDRLFVKKMESASGWSLQDHAYFGLGIVTGDNHRYLQERKSHFTKGSSASDANWQPILCGKQLFPYRIEKELPSILYHPQDFQQMTPEHHFKKSPKFFYRFIATHPIVALDDRGLLSINSVNFFYLLDESYPPEVLLLYLNSSAIRRYYQLHFRSAKVLKSALISLPFPKPDEALFQQLKTLYSRWKKEEFSSSHSIAFQIDRLIKKSYQLLPQ